MDHLSGTREATSARRSAAGAVAVKLFFFGGRYLSVLIVARLLGEDATGYLFAVSLAEALRLLCDFGLESYLIANLHVRDRVGTARFRLITTAAGQLVCSLGAGLVATGRGDSMTVALLGSLHFALLMSFGYMQARLQAEHSISQLIRPLLVAILAQGALLWLYASRIDPVPCTVSFEVLSLLFSGGFMAARRRRDERPAAIDASAVGVFRRLQPLGYSAVLAFLYGKLDIWAVSVVSTSALMTQYLLTQRVATAPLMLLSTVASALVPALAAAMAQPGGRRLQARFLLLGGTGAMLALGLLVAGGLLAGRRTSHVDIDPVLLALQACVTAVQIVNSFCTAAVLARGDTRRLFQVSIRGAIFASIALPLAAWVQTPMAIAAAVLTTELVVAGQHIRWFLVTGRKP